MVRKQNAIEDTRVDDDEVETAMSDRRKMLRLGGSPPRVLVSRPS
jgi:hypothetical protein